MKKLAVIALTLVLSITAGCALFLSSLYNFAESPSGPGNGIFFFNINPGDSFSTVAENLHNKNIVEDIFRFRIYAYINKKDRAIKAGEYQISPSMTPEEILGKFVAGKVYLYKLTIPEGVNISQIGDIIEKSGLCAKKRFIAKAMDKTFAEEMHMPHKSFEGYLFPETYYFPKNVLPQKIIKTMVSRFKSIMGDEWKRRAEEIGLSVHEVVTLASIIEKETGTPSERPIISSVFHNRLKKGMRLESDPTVIYGIKDFDGDIKRKHLREETPYNTYVIKGLPPGPIASPGYESLKAALHPAKTSYFFFVAKGDGTHYFSRNYNEHLLAVRKYQLGE